MANIETSISINQPVEKVFEYLTNVQNQKAGSPNINEINVNGKIAVGTHYTVKMTVGGRAFESEHEIVALEPNKKFGIKTLAKPPAAPVTNMYTLEKDGSGTKLQLSMDAAVMPGTEGMVVPQLRASLDTALAGIKKQLGG
jgi:carbon monoxide dehydrogenase subunit G